MYQFHSPCQFPFSRQSLLRLQNQKQKHYHCSLKQGSDLSTPAFQQLTFLTFFSLKKGEDVNAQLICKCCKLKCYKNMANWHECSYYASWDDYMNQGAHLGTNFKDWELIVAKDWIIS